MRLSDAAAKLEAGESVSFVAHGNSMTPRIESGDTVTVDPVADYFQIVKGDVVLVKVHGRWMLHLVTATNDHRVQIGNNHGHTNGWAMRSKIVGKLRE